MEIFSGGDGTGNLAIVVGVGGLMITLVVSSIFDNWRKVRVAEQTAVLKQTMIEKGMSADEIERVLAAGSRPKRRSCCSKEA